MAKADHIGKRKTREHTHNTRKPKLGYYIIFTDTDATERLYLEGLRNSFSSDIQQQLVIKVEKKPIQKNLLENANST